MISIKSALLFVSGVAAGAVLTSVLVMPGAIARADEQVTSVFRDVPAKHAAAVAVAKMKKTGIISGYPDYTYQGSKPVTRYELAVVLARFAQYFDTSKAPIATSSAVLPPAPAWSAPARMYLASNGFVSPSSNLFAEPGTADVTANLLSDSLSSTIDRLIDRSLPPSNQ